MMYEDVENKWDQLPNEPDRAYARFLVYLHLGPGRSVEKAHNAGKSVKTRNGQWESDCTEYKWPERAAAFDVSMLSQRGAEVVVNWVQSIIGLSRLALDQIESGTIKPESVEQLLEVVNVLSSFITPEVIEASRDMASGDFGRKKDADEGG